MNYKVKMTRRDNKVYRKTIGMKIPLQYRIYFIKKRISLDAIDFFVLPLNGKKPQNVQIRHHLEGGEVVFDCMIEKLAPMGQTNRQGVPFSRMHHETKVIRVQVISFFRDLSNFL